MALSFLSFESQLKRSLLREAFPLTPHKLVTESLCIMLTYFNSLHQFSSVHSLSRVQLLATPWTASCQASLSITNSWSPPKPMSIESVMPSNNLILCCPLLLLPPIPPSIKVFSNESALQSASLKKENNLSNWDMFSLRFHLQMKLDLRAYRGWD